MQIYLKCDYGVLGRLSRTREESEFTFTVPAKNNTQISVIVDTNESSAYSLYETEISDGLWDVIRNHELGGEDILECAWDELSQIERRMSNACRTVLNLVKYCLSQTDLKEELISGKGSYWSRDGVEWRELPKRHNIIADIGSISPLYQPTAAAIQEYIDDAFQPLLAMRHLHRAQNEGIIRYKWIDATIAAEMAIKEFLIRHKPELKSLLVNLPAPPLQKLYGSVLQDYTGRRSPKLSAMAKGAEIRNKLIHNPAARVTKDPDKKLGIVQNSTDGAVTINISTEQAWQYVHDVEDAIRDLMERLYPGDYRTHFAF